MKYPVLPLSLDSPLSVWYEKLYNRIKASGVSADSCMAKRRTITFLSDPSRWFEAFAVCEYAIDTACDVETTSDFFEWIFKGFDCNALVDLNDTDYAWFWQKMQALFDRFSPVAPEALVEKALQYFSGRREYADKEKTFFYLNQAIERGSEAAETILGYYYYLGMLGTTDKVQGMAMMNRAVTERGKARVAIYKGYIALSEKCPRETEALLASLDPLTSDPFVNRLVLELQAYLHETKGLFEAAAQEYRKVLEWIPSGFAMLRLGGLHYEKKLVDSDPLTGLEWMEKAFRYGRSDAAEALFYSYFESGEAWQDEISALAWLEKGFKYNNGFCTYQLADLYLYNDAYKNRERGLYYLEWAMRMNYAEAYMAQAYRSYEGDDGEKNLSVCRNLLEQAIELGSGDAAYRLGDLYDCGEMSEDGIPDRSCALEWYEKAGEMDCLSGCEYAGRYHLTGICGEPDPVAAKQWYEKGVELGSPYCMVELALMYADGIGVEKDFSKSLSYIQQAAEMNDAYAAYLLGRCYKYGTGIKENPVKAVFYFRKAAEHRNVKAQAELGLCYETGYGVDQDWSKAFDYIKQAAEQDLPDAQYRLGYYYMYGLEPIPADYTQALHWLRLAADHGQPYALLELGDYYLYDYEEIQERWKAYPYYRKAAELDCVNDGLGICLEYGYGVEVNEREAFNYYLKGAGSGFLGAMFRVGVCYYYGTGVKENKREAFRWFNQAAGEGEVGSIYYQGKMQINGEGCDTDLGKGIALLRQAAENENKYAQFDLGNCYLAGKGVEENPDVAMEWFERAAANGHEQALKVTGRRKRR